MVILGITAITYLNKSCCYNTDTYASDAVSPFTRQASTQRYHDTDWSRPLQSLYTTTQRYHDI